MVSYTKKILEFLKSSGINDIFMVSGTDYASFIEEYSKGGDFPNIIVIPHEITAVSAALGYSMSSKIGVAFIHTTPGTANSIGIIMNAYSARRPLLIIAGRSPNTLKGDASRNLRIHWGQEAKDQGEMVRQWVKFEFEIRDRSQVIQTLKRAIRIAEEEPAGPVYISIPREITIDEAL
ncbi:MULTISPECIES: thiamine pyrophosphate-binding protein [Acidiplasma]|jgi:acetolactate synthase-1/2/3 large subunit|uniref:Thiamine pyrophosphate enzyme N-terminal TPP-binding domain-containing protein n=2 Tax=Acidiplasma TaxID=507753 RepID=A0A0Q0VSH2_9ARCH|nr:MULTISPECIES: thiamine pyrophosphate-binding protein [Acidiplasma]KQB36571.1 hypothetical protein AOG54_07235 [Acidiplasma aeolicum]KQB36814.1 hypothetical protein AOG55_00020 [Acidiplasma cupricumulans]